MVDINRRNRAYGLKNALQKLAALPIVSRRAPTTGDLSQPIGTIWIDRLTNRIWILASVTSGAATWTDVSGTVLPEIETLTGDSGGAVGPDATNHNVNIVGGTGITTVGNPGTNTVTINAAAGEASISKYIVDPDGSADYITIQAAMDAANAAGIPATVFVRPGTYVENLTLYDQIDIVGAVGVGDTGAFIINGTHIPPASGNLTIRNVKLVSATDIFNSAVAGTAGIIVMDCQIDVTNGYVFNLPNWTGSFVYFDIGSVSTNDGVVNNTGGATVFMTDATIGAGSGNTMVISGNCTFFNIHFQCPVTIQGTGVTTMNGGCWFDNTLTTAGSAIVEIFNSSFITGANQAVSHGSTGALIISTTTINSSNNPAIGGAGAGTVLLDGVDFLTNSLTAGTLTLTNVGRSSTGGLKIIEGTNATSGLATLVAGTVTVNTTAVTVGSRIQLTHQNNAGTPGFPSVTARVAATSFTITSSNALDTSDIAWFIVEPQ